ncbi:MAG: hypothetical protein ACXADY_25150 [Candidatus Hodarchaeales archaeon]
MVSIGLALTAREKEDLSSFFTYAILVLNLSESSSKLSFSPKIVRLNPQSSNKFAFVSRFPVKNLFLFLNSWQWWHWN